MMDDRPVEIARDRRWMWCGLIALVGVAVAWIPVPTTLGVQVPETAIPGIDPSLVDTSGNEQIWRVWWRARDEYVQLDHQWLVTVGLCMLLAVFVIGLLAAIWIALSPQAEPADTIE